MPYSPRTREDILKELMALVVARSELTDVAEGSVLSHILGAIAEDLEGVEFSIKQVRDSFVLENSSGEALDLRAAELPGSTITRKGASFASGAALVLTRTGSTTDPLTIPAGTRFGRSDSTVSYRTTSEQTIAAGQSQFPLQNSTDYVSVVAEASGTKGNAPIGTINKVISNIPQLGVSHVAALVGGASTETDDAFKERVQLFLSSLVRCQPAALIFLAKGFVSSEGVQFKHAALFEDYERPGYVELIVDDGSGMQQYIKDGASISDTTPAGGQVTFYFEAPAAEPPEFYVAGVQKDWLTGVYPAPVVLEERGLMYVQASEKVAASTAFELKNYKVYTGPIRELQDLIEGDASNPFGSAGYRAAGTRVRVRPPDVEFVDLELRVTLQSFTSVEQALSDISDVVAEFVGDLGPGEPLRFSRLSADVLNRVSSVLDCFVNQDGDRINPSTPKTVLRKNIETFKIIPGVATS